MCLEFPIVRGKSYTLCFLFQWKDESFPKIWANFTGKFKTVTSENVIQFDSFNN